MEGFRVSVTGKYHYLLESQSWKQDPLVELHAHVYQESQNLSGCRSVCQPEEKIPLKLRALMLYMMELKELSKEKQDTWAFVLFY